MSKARREVWPWIQKSLSPRPPSATGLIRDLRATVSIRYPHRKGQIILLIRSGTHRGGERMLDTNKSLDSPKMNQNLTDK